LFFFFCHSFSSSLFFVYLSLSSLFPRPFCYFIYLFICLSLSSSFRCLSFSIFFYSAILFLCLFHLSIFHYRFVSLPSLPSFYSVIIFLRFI
jgi:hypothetical protein